MRPRVNEVKGKDYVVFLFHSVPAQYCMMKGGRRPDVACASDVAVQRV